MSNFIFFDRITDDVVLTKPGRLPRIPVPHTGDRVQLKGGKPGLVNRTLDKEWATVTAVSPKSYLIVEPDIKPGELRITPHDFYQYCIHNTEEEAPTRHALSSEAWRQLRGDIAWAQKERKYRAKLRSMMRSIREAQLQTRLSHGTLT